ncbi:hypothetical protein [Streptomyces sp. NPDC002769]|uniref:hypothetical protein n=1 Tax=Streptomyces sp. NPDC002769 TaxID=3154542 RepID=UPI00332B46EA
MLCLAYGALLILCAGEIIGALVDWSLWGQNQVGDIVLVYGLGAPAPNVTRAGHLALTPGGHATVIIITVVIIAVCSRRGFRWDFVRQILAGISLGLASSIAGAVGIVVAPTVSWAGESSYRARRRRIIRGRSPLRGFRECLGHEPREDRPGFGSLGRSSAQDVTRVPDGLYTQPLSRPLSAVTVGVVVAV